MTCEIDINTSAVWEISKFMQASGRTNYDTLWRDISNLDSALDSLRYYNNPSGSVNTHINEAQHNLDKCKSYCIEPTTNAMCNVASFLQDAAMQYEQTEREICNIWGYREKASCVPSVADVLGALANSFARTAEFIFDNVADFIGNLADFVVEHWDDISRAAEYVIDAITIAGIVAFALSNPVGWVVLLAFGAATAYKYATGGGSLVGDALALGAELAGADKATIEKWRGYGQNAQAIGELFLPGGGVVKAAGMAGKAAMGAEKGGKLANTLIKGDKFSVALRNSTETVGVGMWNQSLGRAISNALNGKEISKTTPFIASYGAGLYAKANPISSTTNWINKHTKFNVSSSYAEGVSKRFDAIGEVKDSKDAVTTLYDSATGESRKPEEERGYNNALSNAWHSCFG